jgi:hypothetical protein
MKKLIVVAMLLIASAAWADSKETLLLKQQLYAEQKEKLELMAKLIPIEHEKVRAALEAVNKELKALAEKEKAEKKAEQPKAK